MTSVVDAARREDSGEASGPLPARAYTRDHGEDDPAIRDWTWPY